MRILANDGISKSGIDLLEKNGFEVDLTKVAQDQLINYINNNSITVLLVRSATKVRSDIIDGCQGLKVIGIIKVQKMIGAVMSMLFKIVRVM